MNPILVTFFLILSVFYQAVGQTLSEKQMRNARASGYAIVAARNPGKSFSIYMIPWDGIHTLEYNANTQINSGWHPQAAIKGNYFDQNFDGSDFTEYSSVILSQQEFNQYSYTGNALAQWWIVCSTLPSFSNSSISIDLNGNVGIGTSAPNAKLEVVGNGQFVRNPNAGDYTTSRLYNDQNSIFRTLEIAYSGSLYGGSLLTGGTIGESGSISTTGAHPLSFGTCNIARMTILANGNVGIGTNSPNSFKLAVEGKIGAREINVLTGPWPPDYVFEKNYNLPSLESVKAFVNQNKHLPEVPSAKEMVANGVNLGEMNMLLLKKIEELTLYVVEANEKIDALNAKVNALESHK